MPNYYCGGAPPPSYREQCLNKAGDAFSVAGRQRWESLADSGPLAKYEMVRKRDGAWSVAERQFWEARLAEL